MHSIVTNKVAQLILLSLLVRIITIFLIGKTPCMEPSYLFQGEQIFKGTAEILYLSSLYAIVVYVLTLLTGSLFTASALIFILGSTLTSVMIYLIAKHFFGEKTGAYALLFAIFLPNLTVAISGFAHSVILGTALDLSAIYFLLKYYENPSYKRLLWVCAGSVLSIYTRPETLIILVPFFMLFGMYQISNYTENKKILIRNAILYVAFICLFCFAHKQFVYHNSKNKATANVFSDSKYSYLTFIHTYSIRYFDVVDDDKAIKASTPFIGTPEENHYSVFKAVIKNPKQFVSNIFFNMKEMLDFSGHPLFIPVFLYMFIGALFLTLTKEETVAIRVVLLLLLLHLVPLILFHVSIKYLTQVSSLVLILVAFGASKLNLNKYVLIGVTGLISIVFLMYFINNMVIASLCG